MSLSPDSIKEGLGSSNRLRRHWMTLIRSMICLQVKVFSVYVALFDESH